MIDETVGTAYANLLLETPLILEFVPLFTVTVKPKFVPTPLIVGHCNDVPSENCLPLIQNKH